jgi:UDP-N-acetylmuramoyl-tripeptide--D-alanyl-D-alanine ligase
MTDQASFRLQRSMVMEWSLGGVSTATGGRIASGGRADTVVAGGVAIDSRTLRSGELFVAVRGRRDGHEFLADAVGAGAAALMVDQPDRVPGETGVPAVVVADTSAGLLDLGRAARRRITGTVVGITGSVGKTSTKDLTAAAVAAGRLTVASERSFNNELGVPLTLVNADPAAEVVVLEMGARGPGHVRLLCGVACPTVAVVTAVAPAHTATFGGLEAIAEAKSELVQALPPTGTAVLNADDVRVWDMRARGDASVIGYSVVVPAAAGASVVAERIRLDPMLRARFEARTPWGTATVRLEARGAHQVGNALAALAVAGLCGVDLDLAVTALERARLSPWRMEVGRASSGALVLNDAYNANPASTAAALQALADVRADDRIAVLGPMAELGARSAADHRDIAALAHRLGIRLVAVGTELYGGEVVAGVAEAAELLIPLRPSDAVLVKASRVAGLEELAARLLVS